MENRIEGGPMFRVVAETHTLVVDGWTMISVGAVGYESHVDGCTIQQGPQTRLGGAAGTAQGRGPKI